MIRSNPEQVISALKEVESRDQREWVSQAGGLPGIRLCNPAAPSPRIAPGWRGCKSDLGEKTEVANANPEEVTEWQALAANRNGDLGIKSNSNDPGVRSLGRVDPLEPFLDCDGKVGADAQGKAERFP